MLLKEFTESEHTGGTTSPISRRNQGILTRHPILKGVKGRIRDTLENTTGLGRVLKYIDVSKNPQIPLILEDISRIGCAPFLLEFLPLLEQIYKLESQFGLGWIDEYDYLFEGNGTDKPPDQDMFLSLARIKQIIEGRVIYNPASFLSPKSLVENYLENELYGINPSQIAGIFLVIEFLHRRIKYLEQLREEHKHDALSLFTQVTACKFGENNPVTDVSQQGPFIEFAVTRKAMNVLKGKKVQGLFYRGTANKTLGQAIVLLQEGTKSSQRHERQHNIAAWSALEESKCVKNSIYFNTKDEILAFMSGGDRDFQSIFQTMFKSPLYDPYVEMKDDDYSYNYWREDYRKTLLIGIICAYLLEQKIGKRNTIDVLTFIHFRSWKSEIRRVFQINIPPAIEVLVGLPGKEKEIFQLLGKLKN